MTPTQFAVCGFLVAPICNILGFVINKQTNKNIPNKIVCEEFFQFTFCTGIITGLIGYILGVLWNL